MKRKGDENNESKRHKTVASLYYARMASRSDTHGHPVSSPLTHVAHALDNVQSEELESFLVRERLYGNDPAFASVNPVRFGVVVSQYGEVSRYRPGGPHDPRGWQPVQDLWNRGSRFPLLSMLADPCTEYANSKASRDALMECMEEAIGQGGLTPRDFRVACQSRWCLQLQEWMTSAPTNRFAERYARKYGKDYEWDDDSSTGQGRVWECDGQVFHHMESAVDHLESVGGKGIGLFRSCTIRIVPHRFQSQQPHRQGDEKRTMQLREYVSKTCSRMGESDAWWSAAFWTEVDAQVEHGADPSGLPLHSFETTKMLRDTLGSLPHEHQCKVANYFARWIQNKWIRVDQPVLALVLLCGCDPSVWAIYMEECYHQGYLHRFAPIVYNKRGLKRDTLELAALGQQLKLFVSCGLFWCSNRVIANELDLPEAQVDAWAVDTVNDMHVILIQFLPSDLVETILFDYILLNEPPLSH